MSLITNSPPTLYPFPSLHEVKIGITSPSTAIYGHSSLFFLLLFFLLSFFFFAHFSFLNFFSYFLFYIIGTKWCNTQDNPCIGLFHNKSHYKVDKLFTEWKNKVLE